MTRPEPSDPGVETQPDRVGAAAPPRGPRDGRTRRRTWWIVGVAGVVVAVVAGLLGGYIGSRHTSASASGSCQAATVAEQVLPSVVTVFATTAGGGGGGSGSGEVIRSAGYILTNDHVISPGANGGSLRVLFSSGQSEPATLVGRDIKADLAVLKVVPPADPLPTIAVGRSDTLIVGQPVVALGAPLGLYGTVTAGIVSALGRQISLPADQGKTAVLTGAVQTDAAINPGNSGGALVNCQGQLIGVNTAISTVPNAAGQAGGGSVGIGFAIPVDLAITIADEIIKTGGVAYPYFGATVTAIPARIAAQFGAPHGLYVESITPDGPTDKAGIRVGDIITEVAGRPATGTETLTGLANRKRAGDTVDITYVRDGKTSTTTVTLTNQP